MLTKMMRQNEFSCQHNVAIATEHNINVVFPGIKGNTVGSSGIKESDWKSYVQRPIAGWKNF